MALAGAWTGPCQGLYEHPHVFALIPPAPNRTSYGVFLYQTCTFRYRFDENPALIVRFPVSRSLPARILKLAAVGRVKLSQNIARNLFPQKSRLF